MIRFAAACVALLVIPKALAAVDCASDVTITNADDAKELRESCTTLDGNIELAEGISETINLDGLEVINGDILHTGCGLYSHCVVPDAFNLSSTTLQHVNGSIYFWYLKGLKGLSLPALEYIGEWLDLGVADNVTHIDLTNLKRVSNIILDAERLEEFRLDGLEEFNYKGHGDSGVTIRNAGQIDSLDGFFKNALDPKGGRDQWAEGSGIYITEYAIPNVRHVTFGWTRVQSFTIGGTDLTITFGGPDTEDQFIENMKVLNGVQALRRGSAVRNLTIGEFDMIEPGMVDLALPFDQVSSVSVGCNNLQTIELPSEAQQWNVTSLDIWSCLLLDLNVHEWYWPRSLERLTLAANLTNEFL